MAVVLVLTGAAACADRAGGEERVGRANGARAAGPTGNDVRAARVRPPTTIEVEIRDFEYRPAVVEVVPGDTVRWTNHDIVPHTVTSAQGSVATWDSGEITAGGSYTRVIAAADVGGYYCRYHPTMTATLETEEPAGMKP